MTVKKKQGQVVSTTVAPHPAVPESSGRLQVRCQKCTASRTIEAEPEVLAKYTNSLEPWDCRMGFLADGEYIFGCDMTPSASGSSSASAGASMSTPNSHTGIEAFTDQLKAYAQDQPRLLYKHSRPQELSALPVRVQVAQPRRNLQQLQAHAEADAAA